MSNYKYITFGTSELSKDRFMEVRNRKMFCKPWGGLWSSPYVPNEKYMSDWHRWCVCEDFRIDKLSDAVLFNIEKDANIYTIDSLDDLTNLLQEFSQEDEFGLNRFIDSRVLDYERLHKDLGLDGIYLTKNGEIETRWSNPTLYGWDVETLLVFNFDIITEQKHIKL